MLTSYFKIIYRHLMRNKTYVVVNVLGLGVAMAFCIGAYLNWTFDRDFDAFHPLQNEIYRIETVKARTQETYGICPVALTQTAAEEHSAVNAATKLNHSNEAVKIADQTFYERISYADPTFLDLFNFPLLQGTINLTDPTQVVLTERAAKKYFGDINPVGQQITLFANQPTRLEATISGILADVPKNSSIQIEILTSYENTFREQNEPVALNDWSVWTHAVFLQIKDPSAVIGVQDYLQKFVPLHSTAHEDWETHQFRLTALPKLAHGAREVRWNALHPSVPPSAVWGNISMAIMLLITACLNFANTTIALASQRLKEIGVRKVMGSTQTQLALQLLGESLLICIIAAGCSLLISDFLIGWYNQMWVHIELKISFFEHPEIIAFLIGVILLTTLLGGTYPAIYISSFNPQQIFQGKTQFGGTSWLSRTFLGSQVAISMMTLIMGFSFAYNAYFQENSDLGYLRDGIQAVYTGDEATFTSLKNEISQQSKVNSVAGVRTHIGDSAPRIDVKINGEFQETEQMAIGRDYLELMEIQTIAGRSFQYDLETDYSNAIMVNQQFANTFFPNQEIIGAKITIADTLQYTIIGVVKNFVQDSFFDPTRPLILDLEKADQFQYLVARSDAQDMPQVRAMMAGIWKDNFPNKPFEHYYQNDFLAEGMEVTSNIKWTMAVVAVISLLLTLTGLSALVSLNIVKRMKEVAIRRVLGASVQQIFILLNRQFSLILLVGVGIGIVGGGYSSLMLLGSIYQIHSGLNNYLLAAAGSIILTMIFIVLVIKIIHVVRNNPATFLQD